MIVKKTEEALDACLGALGRSGSVLLVPTETVYGLVCAWHDTAARARIYQLKHRSENKPFAAFLPSVEAVFSCIPQLPDAARIFAGTFCPGPITLVVPDGAGSTFGFRIPDHPFILKLLKACAMPLASTSANRSGMAPALSVAEALETIDGEPDVTVDGGVLIPGSKASTVVLVNADSSWKILREGPVTGAMLENAFKGR